MRLFRVFGGGVTVSCREGLTELYGVDPNKFSLGEVDLEDLVVTVML